MQDRIVVCAADHLHDGEHMLVHTRRGTVGVYKVDGDYRALKNICPHAGAQLCLGRASGTTAVDRAGDVVWVREGHILRCIWHGWEFDLDTGETLTTPRARVATYRVTVEDDQVILHV